METQRSRRGCTACRVRHLKCDETRPACLRCQAAKRDCERGPLISQWREPKWWKRCNAPKNQEARKKHRWVEIPSTLTFVAENMGDDMLSQPSSAQEQNEEASMRSSREPTPLFGEEEITGLPQVSANAPPPSHDFQCPTTGMGLPELSSLDFLGLVGFAPDVSCSDSDTGINLDLAADEVNPVPPVARSCLVKDRTEARLLRHYCQTLAPWFDVTDSRRHFQLEVPQKALACDVLLNAIFALSALHLSRVFSFDPSIAELYHSRCNTQLIPLLNDSRCVTNENVLATVVILRKYEELSVVITGEDHGHHLAGVAALFNAPDCALSEGLGQAAFWQFVRQDLYMSLPKREPPRTSISIQPPFPGGKSNTDCDWANRMVWETVAIMTLCFRDEHPDAATHKDYTQRLNKWHEDLPASFTPIFYQERSPEQGHYFPEIWLSNPWHATGLQYYHLARILLALYNPTLQRPAAGLEYQRAHKQMERDVLQHARIACGIALSNDFVTTRFTLCALMLTCGGWFRDPNEQAAIVELLSTTGRESGWPTHSVIEALDESWAVQ